MNYNYKQPAQVPHLGVLIRAERHALGLTQTELSRLLGISPSYVSSLERNLRHPSAGLLRKIHETLHISYDYLFDMPPFQAALLREAPASYETRFHSLLSTTGPMEQEICYRLCQAFLLAQQTNPNLPITKMSSQEPHLQPQEPKTNL